MSSGSRTTAKELKASIKDCADSAFVIAPNDAERCSRLFCAFLSNTFEASDPSLFAALRKVAGLDQVKQA